MSGSDSDLTVLCLLRFSCSDGPLCVPDHDSKLTDPSAAAQPGEENSLIFHTLCSDGLACLERLSVE